MKHYVDLKFRQETFTESLLETVKSVLRQACDQISGFQAFELLHAKDWSEDNRKVLLVLEFADSESLKTYIAHHLHIQLLQTVKPHLADKTIFDGLI